VIERCSGCRGLFVEASEVVHIDRERLEHATEQIELQLRTIMIDAGWTLLAAGAIARIVLRFM
jgi:hypothetical protein